MHIISILGQIIFGVYWLRAGINHLKNIEGLAGYSASKKIPYPKLAVIATGALLVLGGIGITFGIYVRLSLIAVAIFLIPTTFLMHNFWSDTDPATKMSNEMNFTKNMALLGATLILLSVASIWPFILR